MLKGNSELWLEAGGIGNYAGSNIYYILSCYIIGWERNLQNSKHSIHTVHMRKQLNMQDDRHCGCSIDLMHLIVQGCL